MKSVFVSLFRDNYECLLTLAISSDCS